MSLLDVGNMSPAEVLMRLYNAAFTKGLGARHFSPEDMTLPAAERLLASAPPGAAYVDYLNGRVIKCDVRERPLDVRLYDRDNGEGAAARALGVTP